MMKTRRILSPVLLLLFLLGSTQMFAQVKSADKASTPKRTPLMYLQLDESQQEQAKTFFTEMQKEMTYLRLDIQEKTAALDKLMIVDEPNEKAIFAQVDEISGIKSEMQKIRITSKLKLRSILDEDQRVRFDAHSIQMKTKKAKMSKKTKANLKCPKKV